MLHRRHVILGDGVEHVADEEVLVGVPDRQERRVARCNGSCRRHCRPSPFVVSLTRARYRGFSNGKATFVVSVTQGIYRGFVIGRDVSWFY